MSDSIPAAEIPSTATDLELLRAFEPIVRYTRGEPFYPMDVERYVEASSLWLYHPDGQDEEIVSEGSLTMDELVEQLSSHLSAPSSLPMFTIAPAANRRSRASRRR
jgi:hypothetical protein